MEIEHVVLLQDLDLYVCRQTTYVQAVRIPLTHMY